MKEVADRQIASGLFTSLHDYLRCFVVCLAFREEAQNLWNDLAAAHQKTETLQNDLAVAHEYITALELANEVVMSRLNTILSISATIGTSLEDIDSEAIKAGKVLAATPLYRPAFVCLITNPIENAGAPLKG
jgi:hypothetical protein